MADSDRPEKDELNKIKKIGEWEEFMLGIDPAWHEYKGPIKQDD